MGFIYETHLHTCDASKCGVVHGEDYIPFMMKRGYSGLFVTDHFFNGNTCVPADLSWEERVEIYCSGYERALKAAEGLDFLVMFGIEFNFEKDEYLIYGVDKKWLLDNECIMTMTRKELQECVHKAGGIMIQAHPYRERDYISEIRLGLGACDGIEVYNAGNSANMNALGYEYCSKYGLPMTAGSDIHNITEKDMGGMLFEKKIESAQDYVKAFKEGLATPVVMNADGRVTPVKEVREQTVSVSLPNLPVIYTEGEPRI